MAPIAHAASGTEQNKSFAPTEFNLVPIVAGIALEVTTENVASVGVQMAGLKTNLLGYLGVMDIPRTLQTTQEEDSDLREAPALAVRAWHGPQLWTQDFPEQQDRLLHVSRCATTLALRGP